jgi:hypothetical protein
MVPIEQKDQADDGASKSPQNHPLDCAKRQKFFAPAFTPKFEK